MNFHHLFSLGLFRRESRLISARQCVVMVCVSLFSLLLSAPVTAAIDIYDLQKSGDIEVIAWVGEQPKIGQTIEPTKVSVNEQVILTIEVATPRWLTGGTRIGSIEIPNVIAKQRNQLATNYTQRVGSTTWSRQRWEVTLYPQTSGEFVIPTLPVSVQVSAPDGSNVAGTLYTQPMKFEASLPSGLLGKDTPWFAATSVEVLQDWDRSSEELKVGDAITRKITINAQDSLSVLIPDLLSNESTQAYQAYPQPNRLDDTQVRGDYRSNRVEESVYIIQQGGMFELPEYSFKWWNTKEQRVETVVIDGKSYHAKHTLQSFIKTYSHILVYGVSTLLALVFIGVFVRRYYQNKPTPDWLVFRRLVKAKDWPKLRAHIYKQLRVTTAELELSKASNEAKWQKDSQLLQQGRQDHTVVRRIWARLRVMKRRRLQGGSNNKLSGLKIPKALPELDDKSK